MRGYFQGILFLPAKWSASDC